jgi:hypothetical protein
MVKVEINSYRSLKEGWDGECSIRPSDETLDNAIGFVDSLGSLLELIDEDYIYPTGDGTVIIDFQNDRGDLASVEIGQKSIGYFFQSEGRITEVNSYEICNEGYLLPKLQSLIESIKNK